VSDPANILAIDPAWTASYPSGVALVRRDVKGWSCVALAPSYDQFIDLANGTPVDWTQRPFATPPSANALLDASRTLLGSSVDLVCVDMPISRINIVGRRPADDEVSRRYGAQKCGTHSPSALRPGVLGEQFTRDLEKHGYQVASAMSPVATVPAVIEVYPHPALLQLLRAPTRVPYKIAKSASYYRNLEPRERRTRIVTTWREILFELTRVIANVTLELPPSSQLATIPNSELKRYEDTIDALICAWIGVNYLEGRCEAFGDEHAAIWLPLPDTSVTVGAGSD
jgi:predicted RNase H-like nuclease